MIYKRKTHKVKFVSAALVVALLSGVYAYYQSDKVSAQSNLTADTSVADVGAIDGPGLISIVDKIESIKLDNTIFTDPVFTGLQDRNVTLPSQVVGRSNPFAPLGGQATQTTTR